MVEKSLIIANFLVEYQRLTLMCHHLYSYNAMTTYKRSEGKETLYLKAQSSPPHHTTPSANVIHRLRTQRTLTFELCG